MCVYVGSFMQVHKIAPAFVLYNLTIVTDLCQNYAFLINSYNFLSDIFSARSNFLFNRR